MWKSPTISFFSSEAGGFDFVLYDECLRILLQNFLNFLPCRGLVWKSPTILLVKQYSICTFPYHFIGHAIFDLHISFLDLVGKEEILNIECSCPLTSLFNCFWNICGMSVECPRTASWNLVFFLPCTSGFVWKSPIILLVGQSSISPLVLHASCFACRSRSASFSTSAYSGCV